VSSASPAPSGAAEAYESDEGAHESAHETQWSKGCGSCRSTYGSAAWAALPLAFSLASATVQAHLTVPAAWTVEVRRCACGAMIAARRQSRSALPYVRDGI
jgi:hypothetical protein